MAGVTGCRISACPVRRSLHFAFAVAVADGSGAAEVLGDRCLVHEDAGGLTAVPERIAELDDAVTVTG